MSRVTQDTTRRCNSTGTGLSPSMVGLSKPLLLVLHSATAWSYYPDDAETSSVWASPRSLATTRGITFVFSSYRY